MSREASHRYLRRAQTRAATQVQGTHWHVGDAVFRSRQDAASHAKTIARALRSSVEADGSGLLCYVVSVADAVESVLRVESCDLSCET